MLSGTHNPTSHPSEKYQIFQGKKKYKKCKISINCNIRESDRGDLSWGHTVHSNRNFECLNKKWKKNEKSESTLSEEQVKQV